MRFLGWLAASGSLALLMACGGEEFTSAPSSTTGATGSGGQGGGTTTTGTGGATATSTSTSTGGTGGSGGSCADADLDGVTDCGGDCDDADPSVYPGAPEICGDGVDNGCAGAGDPAACNGIGTYVSALTGNDANPGTKASPVATIGEGMNKATQLPSVQPVFVAEGTYKEDVTLVEGVDLLGGHQCDGVTCGWQRDPALHVSTIEDQDPDGIYAGHNVTRETLVEGFTVVGLSGNPGSGSSYSALFIQGAPTLRGNHVIGGAVSGCGQCAARGISLSGAPSGVEGALVDRNRIDGGDSAAVTVGIDITNASFAEIVGNEIKGGSGNWTRCIAMGGSAASGTVIRKNKLHAGGCAGSGTTFAVYVGQGVDVEIDQNLINADPAKVGSCPAFAGNWWTGGVESEGSIATLTNNVILGVPSPRSTAVLLADCEGACQVGQAIVNGNTMDGVGIASNATVSAALVFKTWKQGQNVVVGRVRNNVLRAGLGQSSFAAYEDVFVQGSTCRPQAFENNDLVANAVLYFLWNGTTGSSISLLSDVNSFVNGAANNIGADCQLDATFHLTAGSPCIEAGVQTPGESPAWDMDGDLRPQGNQIDIGADEAN